MSPAPFLRRLPLVGETEQKTYMRCCMDNSQVKDGQLPMSVLSTKCREVGREGEQRHLCGMEGAK